MENDIIYLINGLKYVLIEMPIMSEYRRTVITDRMKRHGGILQSATVVNPGMFTSNYINCKILIPEANLYAFNLEGLK